MRELKNYKRTSYDEKILSMEAGDEYIEIMKAKKELRAYRLELRQVRFLKQEAKRLGWSEAATLRGIINMYMEEVSAVKKGLDIEDLKIWT